MTVALNGNIKTLNTLNEINEILVLFNDSFPRPLSERIDFSEYAAKLFENAVVKVIYENGEIAGFIAYYCNDSGTKAAFLTQIAVTECKKKKGFGGILLDDCISHCIDEKMDSIICEVDNNNENAISFYRKKGFVFHSTASDKSQFLIKKL